MGQSFVVILVTFMAEFVSQTVLSPVQYSFVLQSLCNSQWMIFSEFIFLSPGVLQGLLNYAIFLLFIVHFQWRIC